MSDTYNAENESATRQLARQFAETLKAGDVVLLEGSLGTGKSAFCREVIRHLTGNPQLAVPSPTFTLVQCYDSPTLNIWHFDLYRLTSPGEIFALGWEEALADSLLLVEWPDRLGSYTPEGAYTVAISDVPGRPDARTIVIAQNC